MDIKSGDVVANTALRRANVRRVFVDEMFSKEVMCIGSNRKWVLLRVFVQPP